MRTAPAPNIPPLPGMCPGEFLMAGGAAMGGSGDGGDGAGDDKEGAGTSTDGQDATSDQKAAPDYEKYPTCGTESHPVDVVTGRVFTHPVTDLELPGPLPFAFERSYSSSACREDQGLGLGWGHSLGWFVEVRPRRVTVWNERGVSVDFPVPEVGHSVLGEWGWVLRRDTWGYAVDAGDDVWRVFSATFDQGKTFRLTAIDDRDKNRIAITYDDGRLAEVTDSAGRVIRFTATREGRIGSILVKNAEHQGRWIAFARYQYDAGGRLVRVTDADDRSWQYEYDEYSRLTRDTDRSGLSFCFRYDAKDRGVEAWGEYVGKRDPSLADDVPKFLHDGRTRAKGIYHRKLDYHDRGYTEVTDTTETRRYFGNKRGTLDKAVTGGAVTTSRYDERGFQIEKTDPVGATTRWVRDERGRALQIVDPLGRITRIDRDATGLPVRLIDAAGGVTTAWRDLRGNLQALRDAVGATTQYEYDERGLVTRVTDPVGASTRFSYDRQGNLVELVQPNGGRWVYTYDGLGRRLSTRDPTGAESRYAYSDRGDLVAVYNAVGGVTRYSYDGERHVTQVVSPKGGVTQFVWGGFHKLAARRDPGGQVVRLAYSREGELLAVHNERDEVHRLRYDAAGRLVGEDTIDGRALRYRHDLAGRVVRVENGAGELTHLEYDAAGQLVARELPDGAKETFEYNARRELVRASSASGTFVFERDPLGRIVREVQRAGGEEHWVEVRFDAAGNRLGCKTSLGHTEEVQRDALGARVSTLLDRDHRIDHVTDVLGREVARKLPGGGVVQSSFDAMGRLAQRVARSPIDARSARPDEPEWMGRRDDGVTSLTSYQYDADGELALMSERARGVTRFDHDPVGRLLAAVPETARAEVFRYDAAGNLFEAGEGAPSREYGRGNRLLRKGNVTYEWDGDGRLARKVERTAQGDRVWRYAWNGAGLLERVETPDGRRVEFTYDPFARRLRKEVRERKGSTWSLVQSTAFVWNRDVLVHEIARPAAEGDAPPERRTYLFEDTGFAPVAHRESRAGKEGPWFAYVNDVSGAPASLVDEDGSVACVIERSAWGEARIAPGARTSTPLRFAGQYEDAETGLAYNRARYYAPDEARFISADPLGIEAGLNVFAYCLDPLTWIDPYGLSPADTVLIGRIMRDRVQPAADPSKSSLASGGPWTGAHTYAPGQRGRPLKPENDYSKLPPGLPPTDPRKIAQERAALKNQGQWMRDMIKSGRRICDIGNEDTDGTNYGPSKFCDKEHQVLIDHGYQRVPVDTIQWTDTTNKAHSAVLYEWRKP